MNFRRIDMVQLVATLTLLFVGSNCALVSASKAHSFQAESQQHKSESGTLEAVANATRKLQVSTWQSKVINLVLREFETIAQTANPLPQASVEYVFVLSARSTYKGEMADPKGNPDREDDRNRMNLGLSFAREVTALKIGKSSSQLTLQDLALHGPTIIYNGVPMQNTQLREALISGALHIYYPREKFVIAELPPDQLNTLGQFLMLKRLIHIERTSVAVVTHAFHFPRVSRMLHPEARTYPFGPEVKIIPVLVDRQYQAPGAFEDMMGEIERIPKYIQKEDLFPQPISYGGDQADKAS